MVDHNISHDEALHVFYQARFGIEHKDYNHTDDIPDLNETRENNVQESTVNTNNHSHTLPNRENDVPAADIITQAWQLAQGQNFIQIGQTDPNEIWQNIIQGTTFNTTNHSHTLSNRNIDGPSCPNCSFIDGLLEFNENECICSTIDASLEYLKEGKGSSDMIDDNDDIHDPRSNVMEEGSSSCMPNHYTEQPGSSKQENRRQVNDKPKLSEQQKTKLVNRFCNARELEYCNEGDARSLIDSGYDVKKVDLRNYKGKDLKIKGKFNCLFCPIMQKHERGFDRKEDIKRHYYLHLDFKRFQCKYCDSKKSRPDHMKNHMKTFHPDKKLNDYHKI